MHNSRNFFGLNLHFRQMLCIFFPDWHVFGMCVKCIEKLATGMSNMRSSALQFRLLTFPISEDSLVLSNLNWVLKWKFRWLFTTFSPANAHLLEICGGVSAIPILRTWSLCQIRNNKNIFSIDISPDFMDRKCCLVRIWSQLPGYSIQVFVL